MKIIRVCGSYFPAKKMGGAVTADFTLDKALTEKGHQVIVVTTYAGLDDIQKIHEEDIEGVSIKRFTFFGGVNYSISLVMLIHLWKILSSFKGVAIFSGIWNLPTLLGPLFCRLLSIPYIITPHGSLYPELIENKKSWLKRFLLNFFVINNLQKAKSVHFTVEAEREAAEEVAGFLNNAVIIPLGVPKLKALSAYGLKKTDSCANESKYKTILFVGRINWKKGIDLLIKGIAKLPKELKKVVRLTLVGPEDRGEINTLKSIVAQCGMTWDRDVTWLGPQYGDELSKSYLMADIYALTSYSENFAVTVVEAAQYGLPILMTNKVGVSAFFKNGMNAEIVGLSEFEIAVALERLISNKSYADELGVRAEILSNRFSVESYSSEFIQVLECINEK